MLWDLAQLIKGVDSLSQQVFPLWHGSMTTVSLDLKTTPFLARKGLLELIMLFILLSVELLCVVTELAEMHKADFRATHCSDCRYLLPAGFFVLATNFWTYWFWCVTNRFISAMLNLLQTCRKISLLSAPFGSPCDTVWQQQRRGRVSECPVRAHPERSIWDRCGGDLIWSLPLSRKEAAHLFTDHGLVIF